MVPRGRLELPHLSAPDPKSGASAISPPGHCLVLPRGIEPRSSVLQTGAMTTSAKAAYEASSLRRLL